MSNSSEREIGEAVWTKERRTAPFDKNGNLLGYADGWTHEFRDVTNSFEATLIYDGYGRGRSSAIFKWKNMGNGTTYEMFMSDMNDLIKREWLRGGNEICGRWSVVKKGANYGIKLERGFIYPTDFI